MFRFILWSVLVLSSCTKQNAHVEFYDPLEVANRQVHTVNKALDTVVLRPVSTVYGAVLPNQIHYHIQNFSSNLAEPNYILNSALQGRIDHTLEGVFRFAINLTFGLLGVHDAAYEFGLPKKNTDFGETMYVWGVGEGAYIEVPFLGGLTIRDFIGRVADLVFDPVSQVAKADYGDKINGVTLLRVIDNRYKYDGLINQVLYENEDSYASYRLYYLQSRRYQLNGNIVDIVELDDPYDFD